MGIFQTILFTTDETILQLISINDHSRDEANAKILSPIQSRRPQTGEKVTFGT